MKEIFDICWRKGVDPQSFIATFGIGGWLINNCTRDSLSSSFKLAAIENNEAGCATKPVVKLSEIREKLSVPGKNAILRGKTFNNLGYSVVYHTELEFQRDARVVFYDNNEFSEYCYEPFSKIQDRVINNFIDMKREPDYGLPSNTCLSPTIRKIQDEFRAKYQSNK